MFYRKITMFLIGKHVYPGPFWIAMLVYRSVRGPPLQCHVYPQEIAGLITRDYKPPLSLIRALFLGGVAFGGAPLDCHELRDR